MRGSLASVLAIPLLALAAASGPVQPQGEPLDCARRARLPEARAAEAQTGEASEGRPTQRKARPSASARKQAAAAAGNRRRRSTGSARPTPTPALISCRSRNGATGLRREQAPAIGTSRRACASWPSGRPCSRSSTRDRPRNSFASGFFSTATLPAIRARTAALRAELERGRKLQTAGRSGAARPRQEPRPACETTGGTSPELEAEALKIAATARRRSARRRRHRAC